MLDLCRQNAIRETLVVAVFANEGYLDVLKLWLLYARRCGHDRFLVFCLDLETYRYCSEQQLPCWFAPYQGDWLGFMRHQMRLTRHILKLGFDCLVSDIDALWIRDPIELTLSQSQDMVFSPGTIQPPEAHASWGNVLCTGYFLLRANERVEEFLDHVEPRMQSSGDQPSINAELLARGLVWDPQPTYELNFRGKTILQTSSTRTGVAGGLKVALLPNHLFQRLPEESEPCVIHPIAPKEQHEKMKVFQAMGLL